MARSPTSPMSTPSLAHLWKSHLQKTLPQAPSYPIITSLIMVWMKTLEGIISKRRTTAEVAWHLFTPTTASWDPMTNQMSSCRKKRQRKRCGRSERPALCHQLPYWSTDRLMSPVMCTTIMMLKSGDLQCRLATVSQRWTLINQFFTFQNWFFCNIGSVSELNCFQWTGSQYS